MLHLATQMCHSRVEKHIRSKLAAGSAVPSLTPSRRLVALPPPLAAWSPQRLAGAGSRAALGRTTLEPEEGGWKEGGGPEQTFWCTPLAVRLVCAIPCSQEPASTAYRWLWASSALKQPGWAAVRQECFSCSPEGAPGMEHGQEPTPGPAEVGRKQGRAGSGPAHPFAPFSRDRCPRPSLAAYRVVRALHTLDGQRPAGCPLGLARPLHARRCHQLLFVQGHIQGTRQGCLRSKVLSDLLSCCAGLRRSAGTRRRPDRQQPHR